MKGGALIVWAVGNEEFSTWITSSDFIDSAIAQHSGTAPRKVPVFGKLLDGTDCNGSWTWHVDPENVSFADKTIELCDGRPSHIEGDKPTWLTNIKQYCPWIARIVSIEDRRH